MSTEVDEQRTALRVAIVGMGPRGLAVLERLLVRAQAGTVPAGLAVWTVDDVEPGVGRIWRVGQPRWLVMNTVAGQVTMYSDGPVGPPRAGHGPSLADWLRSRPDPAVAALRAEDYAPRHLYGAYLRDVYASLTRPEPGVSVHPTVGRVVAVDRVPGGYRVTLHGGETLPTVDAVVIATGHSRYEPTPAEQALLDTPAGATYTRGDSAADLPLETVRPGGWVGVIGMGLTFYDVLASLTDGRGGRFHESPDGRLTYTPSGAEPRILAGSRSGMPFPPRGRNQKGPRDGYRPILLRPEAVARLRADAHIRRGSPQLDFKAEIWPLLRREMAIVHDSAVLRRRHGAAMAAEFLTRTAALAEAGLDPGAARSEFPVGAARFDLDAIMRPFGDTTFDSPGAFHDRLRQLLRADLAAAAEGNVDNPTKAALDILRDMRSVLRDIVDFGGLRPRSHRDDFLGWFHPLYNFLAAGPPVFRVRQAVALIEAGVLHVCGPDTRIGVDSESRRFVLHTPRVAGSRRVVDALVDARIPTPDVSRDTSPLIRHLLKTGLVSVYRNVDPADGDEFRTGGIAIDSATFQAIGPDGRAMPNLYAIGIPTEHTRWFTHMGGGRPGGTSLFQDDADRVARHLLDGDRRPGTRPVAGGRVVTA